MTAKCRTIRRAASFSSCAIPRMPPTKLPARRRSCRNWRGGRIAVPPPTTTCRRCSASTSVARAAGNFDDGIRAALERVLVSPDFLFRIEADPAGAAPGAVYRISDVELASRLSFVLWSSIPDDTLLDLAIRGKLHEPAVLEQQVSRMFADPARAHVAGPELLLRIGCRLATCGCSIRTAPSFPGSTTTCAPRS